MRVGTAGHGTDRTRRSVDGLISMTTGREPDPAVLYAQRWPDAMARPPAANVCPVRTAPLVRLMRRSFHGPCTGAVVWGTRRKAALAAGSTTWLEMLSAVLSRS